MLFVEKGRSEGQGTLRGISGNDYIHGHWNTLFIKREIKMRVNGEHLETELLVLLVDLVGVEN